MHSPYGLAAVNWLTSQRSARESYSTMGSPSLRVWQGPPKPDHMVLPLVGPYTETPLLFQICSDRLTNCTKWLGPTSPLVSGGYTPLRLPRPLKFRIGAGMAM